MWLVSLTQRLSRCLWTMVRPSRRRAPFGLQGGLIPLLVRADRRVMRAHTMENLKPKVCNFLFSGVVVTAILSYLTAVRSNWLRAPQDLNACDWVPSFTIGSTGSRPSTHGTRAASLSDRALSSWQALKKQPRHDAQGEFKQVLKLLVVLDSCEAAAVWLKWHAAGACGLASHPGASASHPGANTAHRSASIHRRRATVEPQHIAALRCRAHEECVWAG